MMPPRRQPLARTSALATLLPLLLLALLLTGCGATVADRSGGPPSTAPGQPTNTPRTGVAVSYSDSATPPAILRNPAPGALDVSLNISFEQGVGDAQLMAEVDLGFTSLGNAVQFAGSERITCDGVTLPAHGRDADFQVVRAPAPQLAGTTIRCDYQAGGQPVAGLLLTIPQPPAITTPSNGASVARGPHTIVTYRYDAATAGTLLGIVALAPGSASPKALARMNTPIPGQATVDTSAFSPGPGSLVLTMTLAPHITGTGAPFKTLTAFGDATAQVNVTWT